MLIRACLLATALCPGLLARGADSAVLTTRSVAADRVAATPGYAHAQERGGSWLEYGLESRSRYEQRWHEYGTPELGSDGALVTRNLLYLGVRQVLDPLRLAVELEDSRRFFNSRPDNVNIQDELDVLQARLELHFEDAVHGQPISLGFGRMAFDWADRRLLARNRNRNTISAFDGLRLRLGDENSPWEIDAIATRIVKRSVHALDASTDNATLAGIAGYWRGGQPHLVLEPYWLWLDQDDPGPPFVQRELHTLGLHAFGQWGGNAAWDHDVSLAGQWGRAQGLEHRAWAAHVEAGRTFAGAWRPRLALWLNYASGDHDPGDGRSGRFDPMFGATYSFYGFSSYFNWQNMVNPAVRLSFAPAKTLRCEVVHRAFWLASSTDAWVRGKRQDRSGASGSFVGQETDLRLVWQMRGNLEIDLAWAHFWPGGFVQETGRSPRGDFLQVAATLRF